jgi:hypothetical protein
MAGPETVAIMALVGSAVSAFGSYRQGQQQKSVAEYNAAIARNEAEAARQKAAFDAETSREKYARLMGRQRALYSKSGVDITSGSPLLLLADQAYEAERDKQAILYSGEVSATKDLNQASMFEYAGENAESAANLTAGTSLVSGIANAGTNYYNMTKYKNRNKGSGPSSLWDE